MVKKILAVDLDDVVIDLNGSFAKWHNATFGTNIEYKDITNFDLVHVYETDLETLIERLDVFRNEYWQEMPLIAGALSALNELKNIYELHIVTARCD